MVSFRNFFLNGMGLGKNIFVILPQLETFLSTFRRLVLLIKTINIYWQFLGLDFLLLTGNWEKNIAVEALLSVVLAAAETEKTRWNWKW